MAFFSFPYGWRWGISRDANHPPPESVRTDARSYADVITKFSRLDGLLPIFFTHGASLARFARWSSAIIFLQSMKCPSWTQVKRQKWWSDRTENGKCTNFTSPGHHQNWLYDFPYSDWLRRNQNITLTAKGLRPRRMASLKEIYVGWDVASQTTTIIRWNPPNLLIPRFLKPASNPN